MTHTNPIGPQYSICTHMLQSPTIVIVIVTHDKDCDRSCSTQNIYTALCLLIIIVLQVPHAEIVDLPTFL